MFGTDVLLSIPTESVAVRAVVASVVALVLVRVLLRLTVRLPRLRAAAVLVPTLSLLAVVAISWSNIDLPALMIGSEADNALPLPFGDNDYIRVAPVTWPVAVGLWSLIASMGVGLRLLRSRATRMRARRLFTLRSTSSTRLNLVVESVAGKLKVPPPPAAVGEGVVGGASVIGVRRPILLVDHELLDRLDDEELEGLVAHELAHVRRRDNLVALLAGLCRDLAFFVPGGRWVVRQLHNEREAAADALAVDVTGRPGALASGLLKAVDPRPVAAGAAAFSPGSTLESRVRRLCQTDEPVGRGRRLSESVAIAGALAASVVVAVGLPAWLAASGDEPMVGVALLWSDRVTPTVDAPAVEHAAFGVYRDTGFQDTSGSTATRTTRVTVDDGRELNPAFLRHDPIDGRAPADRVDYSIARRPSLGLRPAPSVTVDGDLLDRWRATNVLQVGSELGVYVLSHDER